MIVLFAVIGVGATQTSKPSFCNSCHLMQTYYSTWEKSPHKETDCLECHSDPGVAGIMEVKVKGIEQLAITVTGQVVTPKAEVPDSRCLSCHKTFPDTLKKLAKINFPHDKHKEKGLSCIECHAKFVHGTPEVPKMSSCLKCHKENSKAPVDQCNKCHKNMEDVKPKTHQAEAWGVTHGKASLQINADCAKCHDLKKQDNQCIKCHGIQMPHEQQWMAQHGQQVKAQKLDDQCVKCHLQQKDKLPRLADSCQACHKVTMPHPAGWDKGHARQTKNQVDCQYCHSPNNPAGKQVAYTSTKFCQDCHQKTVKHPAKWVQLHGAETVKPAANCSLCHGIGQKQQQFCNSCHAKTNSHPTSWISDHKNEAFARLNDCRKCHQLVSFCSKCHN